MDLSGIGNSVSNTATGFLQGQGDTPNMKTLIGAALIGLLPPLLYSRRNRGGAARYWGGLGTQLALRELGRPEQERARRENALSVLLGKGAVGTTGAPGAKPVGQIGGIDMYQTPTMAQSYPEVFRESSPFDATTPTALPPGDASGTMSGVDPKDLLTSRSVDVTKPPLPIQILGGQQATPQNSQAFAKIMFSEQQRKEEALRRALATDQLHQYAESRGLDVLPGMDSKGNLTYRTATPPSESSNVYSISGGYRLNRSTGEYEKLPGTPDKMNKTERMVSLENQRRADEGQPPMSAGEELEFIQSNSTNLGDQFANALTRNQIEGEARMKRKEIVDLRDSLRSEVGFLPAKYERYAESPTLWASLKDDPEAMKAIGKSYTTIANLHRQIMSRSKDIESLYDEAIGASKAKGRGAKASGTKGGNPLTLWAYPKDAQGSEAAASQQLNRMFGGQ